MKYRQIVFFIYNQMKVLEKEKGETQTISDNIWMDVYNKIVCKQRLNRWKMKILIGDNIMTPWKCWKYLILDASRHGCQQ